MKNLQMLWMVSSVRRNCISPFASPSLSANYNSIKRKIKTNSLIFSPTKHSLRIDRNPGIREEIFSKLPSTIASRPDYEQLRKAQNANPSKTSKSQQWERIDMQKKFGKNIEEFEAKKKPTDRTAHLSLVGIGFLRAEGVNRVAFTSTIINEFHFVCKWLNNNHSFNLKITRCGFFFFFFFFTKK